MLTTAERREIDTALREARAGVVLNTLGCLGILLVLLGHYLSPSLPLLANSQVPFYAVCGLILVGLPTKRALEYLLAYRKDLADDRVRIFRGRITMDTGHGYSGYTGALVSLKILKDEPETIQTLVMMAGSGRIARANGTPPKLLEIVEVVETATPPTAAASAAHPDWMHEVGRTDEDAPILMNRRELSASECSELRILAANLARGLAAVTLVATAGMAIVAWYGCTHPALELFSLPIFYLGCAVALFLWWVHIDRMREAAQLRRAAKIGYLLILRGPDARRRRSKNPTPEDVVMEILPAPKDKIWSVNDKPAAWRTRGG